MKRGQQRSIPTPGQQEWHHVFAAYNYGTDEVISYCSDKKNSDAFIAFLDHLAQSVPAGRPVVIVLDNASYHTSAATKAAFACLEDHLLPVFLPPYCSDLNPIERFWLHLKDHACANKLYASMAELISAIQRWLRKQNCSADSDRFLLSKNFP